MKTPNEARKCWCPFAQLCEFSGAPAFNRVSAPEIPVDQIPPSARCIADECMAWRWDMDPDSDDTNGEVGYCGLAGKPS